ncbi:hypothetical protein TNCV_851501 [Trichonephila clavipes]|nr:hypothetical protein TNCV_851501 [Trichonephila clavipes]
MRQRLGKLPTVRHPVSFQAKKCVVPDDARLASVGHHMPNIDSNNRRCAIMPDGCIQQNRRSAFLGNPGRRKRQFHVWITIPKPSPQPDWLP